MARTYRRDANGRFAGGGGGGGGKKGRIGKATVGRAAKAKYKAALGKAKEAESTFGGKFKEAAGPKGKRYANRQVGGAKSALTRVTKGLRGGKTGNIGRTKADERRSAAQAYAGAIGRTRSKVAAFKGAKSKAAAKPAAKKGAKPMANQVARGREAKKAYKAATSAARQAKMLAGGRTSTKGLGKRTDAGAKNIRANVKAYKSAQAKVSRMESKRKATRRRK